MQLAAEQTTLIHASESRAAALASVRYHRDGPTVIPKENDYNDFYSRIASRKFSSVNLTIVTTRGISQPQGI
jgi:hypothetical protein